MILRKLEKHLHAYENLEGITFVRDLWYPTERSARNEFYFMRSFPILSSSSLNSSTKKSLFELYENYYPNHKNLIKQFKETLEPSTSIHWYTEQPVIYRLFNNICQKEYSVLIYKLQYFIQCLFIQLTKEHGLFMKSFDKKTIIYVYRAQLMTTLQFKRFKILIGKNILATNFLLADFSKDKVIHDVNQCQPSSNEIFFILKIIINTHTKNTQPYAPVYRNNQQQLLIMLGANFHVLDVIDNPHDNVPIVLLELNDNKQW